MIDLKNVQESLKDAREEYKMKVKDISSYLISSIGENQVSDFSAITEFSNVGCAVLDLAEMRQPRGGNLDTIERALIWAQTNVGRLVITISIDYAKMYRDYDNLHVDADVPYKFEILDFLSESVRNDLVDKITNILQSRDFVIPIYDTKEHPVYTSPLERALQGDLEEEQ